MIHLDRLSLLPPSLHGGQWCRPLQMQSWSPAGGEARLVLRCVGVDVDIA
jgi:hypothetical protein